MEKRTVKHLLYCPFTGLGLYNGFRGNRWLKNRIKVFKQFVMPSLQAQTNKNFTLWISWRPEEKNNPIVKEFQKDLENTQFRVVHTFHGLCFYDDKYEDEVAQRRLVDSLHYTVGDLYDEIGEVEYVIMTIQPSDDVYCNKMVEAIQGGFNKYPEAQAIGFKQGYIMNYQTLEIAEYNPKTNPPFYSIKFKKDDFTNHNRHLAYTSMKREVGQYKVGTPLPSHEYVGDCLKYLQIGDRGFLVGCHGENVSTNFNIPYKGEKVESSILKDFGLEKVDKLKMKVPLRKRILFRLPYKLQRKVRYWLTEKFKL